MITLILNLVILRFFVLAELESKKFNNATLGLHNFFHLPHYAIFYITLINANLVDLSCANKFSV